MQAPRRFARGPGCTGRRRGRSARQQGQALVYGLFVLVGGLAALFFLFNTGQLTVPVAARIPDAVLIDLKARPGSLRLKFRLAPEGVLFGWDVERYSRGVVRFDCPGGDFSEARR